MSDTYVDEPELTGAQQDLLDENALIEELGEDLSSPEFYEEGGVTEMQQGEGEEIPFDANLADYMDEDTLNKIGQDLLQAIEDDNESRADWQNIFREGLDLLGLKVEELQEPFPGACAVTHPALIEAIVKFQSKAYGELVPPKGPVSTKIMGVSTPQREAQARRVREFMNYQIMEEMEEWVPEMDRMLFYLGFAGTAFKKTYYDVVEGRPCTQFVTAEDFIIDYNASNLRTAKRYTHRTKVYKNTITKYVASGWWRDVQLTSNDDNPDDEIIDKVDELQGRQSPSTPQDIYFIYESHVDLDLPGFEDPQGIELPYIVTLDREQGKVLAIRRNWKPEDPSRKKRVWFSTYHLIPGFGFYGYGFLHLIGGLAKTATSSLRQLTDSGTFANLQAGFKAHGVRITGDSGPLRPGEFRDVNAAALDITKAIVPLPFKEPSATLFNLMQFVVETAQKFVDATEQVIADSTNYGPVGTTMALLEASAKLFSAIHKRLHFSQKHDLKLLAEINGETLPDEYPYEVAGAARTVKREDFDGRVDIIPVSDPNMPSKAHRLAKAQALQATAVADPQNFNMRAVAQEVVRALDYDEPEAFLNPPPAPPLTADAVSENAAAMMGQAIATGPWQNHDAHIVVHTSLMNDPLMGNNDQLKMILARHVQEHLRAKYIAAMQQQMGMEIPDPSQLPPEVQEQISMLAAQNAEAVLAKSEAEQMEQKQAELMMNPDFMLRNRELDIADKKVDRDYEAKLADIAVKVDKTADEDLNKDLDRITQIAMQTRDLTAKKEIEANRAKVAAEKAKQAAKSKAKTASK